MQLSLCDFSGHEENNISYCFFHFKTEAVVRTGPLELFTGELAGLVAVCTVYLFSSSYISDG